VCLRGRLTPLLGNVSINTLPRLKNIHATEELLNAVLSIRSMSHEILNKTISSEMYLHDSQSRETVKYGRDSHGTRNQE
jgi:hypothetical protein